MSTRIRYGKVTEDTLVSKDFFPTDQGNVRVVLETITKRFKLTAVESAEVMAEGEAKNMSELKKAVKRQLKLMGVQFHSESRTHKEKV